MAYNLTLATQEFSADLIAVPQFQQWSFTPPSILEVPSFIGSPNPANIDVATKIKDYIAALGTGTYDEFYVQLTVVHPLVNGQTLEWLTVTGEIAAAAGDGYLLTTSNLAVTTTLAFSCFNVPYGSTGTEIHFKVYGKPPVGSLVLLQTIKYYVKLRRLNPGDIYITPSDLIEYGHVIGQPLPDAEERMIHTNSAFTITVGDHIAISGGNIVLDSDVGGVKTYSGSNSQTLTFALEASIEAGGPTNYYAEAVFQTPTNGIDVQGIRVYVYADGEVNITPASMAFTAIKGVLEANQQNFTIQGYGAFVITVPFWLDLIGPNAGENNTTREVKPIPTANMSPGFYTGNIKIAMAGDDYFIAVTYKLIGNMETGFTPGVLNFTKDRTGISNFYSLDENYLRLLMDFTRYTYKELVSEEKTYEFRRGIYQNHTDFYLGRLIDTYMYPLKSLSQVGYFDPSISATSFIKYHNPAEVKLTAKFINRETGVGWGQEEIFYDIKFIKGRKPSRILSAYGIIDYKESDVRVTSNSFALLNVYTHNSYVQVATYKNGVLHGSVNVYSPDHRLIGVRLWFNQFAQGDVIDIRVSSPFTSSYFSQRYIMFRTERFSYHIVWENEHGLLEALEFTGSFQFSTDYNHIIARTFKEYLEATEKYATERALKFVANTGWVLKVNQERIDSLVDSKLAWIIPPGNATSITVIPQTAKIVNTDSDQGNYEYSLEFKINPEDALKNYSF